MPHKQYVVTPDELREAIDGLKEASEARRNDLDAQDEHKVVNVLIADVYDCTAEKLASVRRILERDQAILRPIRTVFRPTRKRPGRADKLRP
jgi:hypothetical protein